MRLCFTTVVGGAGVGAGSDGEGCGGGGGRALGVMAQSSALRARRGRGGKEGGESILPPGILCRRVVGDLLEMVLGAQRPAKNKGSEGHTPRGGGAGGAWGNERRASSRESQLTARTVFEFT